MSIESYAKAHIRVPITTFPNGARAMQRKLLEEDEECDPIGTPIPDAWSFHSELDGLRNILTFYEIEDWHPVSRDRLRAYGTLWNDFDCINTSHLSLVTLGRWGEFRAVVDLPWVWRNMCQSPPTLSPSNGWGNECIRRSRMAT